LQENRLEPVRELVWWEIIVGGIISWFIKKTLDYVWDRGTKRAKAFKFLLPSRLSYFYQKFFLYFYINFYLIEENAYPWCKLPIFPDLVKGILKVHRRLHIENQLSMETCQYCKIILKEKPFLQKFVSSPEFYPPFAL
jgi:hypothetical protein